MILFWPWEYQRTTTRAPSVRAMHYLNLTKRPCVFVSVCPRTETEVKLWHCIICCPGYIVHVVLTPFPDSNSLFIFRYNNVNRFPMYYYNAPLFLLRFMKWVWRILVYEVGLEKPVVYNSIQSFISDSIEVQKVHIITHCDEAKNTLPNRLV